MVSLVLFVFAGLWLEGMYDSHLVYMHCCSLAARALYQLDSDETFLVVITVLNLVQWSVLIALPMVQVCMSSCFLWCFTHVVMACRL